jgi:hypothetical protein
MSALQDEEFDSRFRQRFEEGAPLPAEDGWAALSSRLEQHAAAKPARSIPMLKPALGVAASVLAVVAVLYFTQNSATPDTARKEGNRIAAKPAAILMTAENSVREAFAATDMKPPTGRGVLASRVQGSSRPFRAVVPAVTERNSRFSSDANTPAVVKNSKDASQPVLPQSNEVPKQPGNVMSLNPEEVQQGPVLANLRHFTESMPSTERPGQIGVQGGVSSIGNGGFAVGIAYQKPVSKKVFLEATLAYSGASFNTATPGSPIVVNNIPSNPQPGMTSEVPTVIPTVQHVRRPLSYLQLTPLVGYKLGKRLAGGLGGDVQRRLGSSSEAIAYSSDGRTPVSQYPDWDLGLLAKGDVSLTNRFKAGVAYRQSVAAFAESKIPTEPRSYWTIQLQYRLIREKN